MSVSTVTHLNFLGQAREALEFYRSVFGGQVMIATYADFGMPAEVPGAGDVVWGQVVAENGFTVMAYDVPARHRTDRPAPVTRREQGTTITDQPFFVSVRGESVDEVEVLWKGLAEGATVVEQFGPAPWAPAFGMLTDRFGVTWILDVAASY
ncbi:VOC family protein [Actinomycetospora atypica]|uniref:VOC family protein n=1 Tax=Actinomycetospora atypica TaxID=1290095 RepID=A0ABV9YEW2_9PSEU